MSSNRPLACLAAFVLAFALTGAASAQQFQPFIDVDYFQPDFQFFAPAEVSEFGGGEPPNTGFFLTYDRMYINVTRPDDQFDFGSGFDGDFTWGNRVDMGYMTDEEHGWLMTYYHIGGPQENFRTLQETLGRTIELGGMIEIPDYYDIDQSLNIANFASFELNKVWRRKEFHNGSILEPFMGVRWMQFVDFYQRETYGRFDEDADNFPDLTMPNGEGPFEVMTLNKARFENNMLGGQLGFRYYQQVGHWLLSGEFRAFALQNWQFLKRTFDTTFTRWDGAGNGSMVDLVLVDRDPPQYFDAAEFVWGGEVRAEAAYEVTRDISLRVGFVFIDLGQGIGRGNQINANFQDVQMAGVTFGFTFNR